MVLGPDLQATVAATLGAAIVRVERVTGGDINDTFVITLADGRRHFLKTHAKAPRGMYQAEATGLRWLADAHALRVPAVIAHPARDAAQQFLVLELIESAPRAADHDLHLGRGLAALHRTSPPTFGLPRANFIATLAQTNEPADAWPTFYAARRLEPMLKRAVDAGVASAGLKRADAEVMTRIVSLVGTAEPPARLHGDLWGGNAITDEHGLPVLIDPAVYGGHREVDLAMMRLFGGFGPRVFDAYQEAFPLTDGHAARVPLYQLYPLLVHVNLFGGHYLHSAEQAAKDALSA